MLLDYDFKNYNFRLAFYVLLLNLFGILVISSATNQNMAFVGKQIFGVIAGFAIVTILSLIDYHKIVSSATIVYIICVIGLIAVLLFGENVNNATRWLKLPIIGQVQPSEFVKIGLIVFFSWFFSKNQEKLNLVLTLAAAGIIFAVPFFLIFKEPNLSTALVTLFVFLCMLFVAGLSYRWILTCLAVGMPVGVLFVYLLQFNIVPFIKEYQARRILAFINPSKYADANLQQDNSVMAIGSGRLQGKWIDQNELLSVKNGGFLSEEQTDFIFAVVGEEFGFIGSTIVILLIALIVYECLYMAAKARDLSGQLLCAGMASLLAFQSFANIAVATKIFPNTGLPLPFVSYGVSSLVSTYIGIGLIMNVGLQRKLSNH